MNHPLAFFLHHETVDVWRVVRGGRSMTCLKGVKSSTSGLVVVDAVRLLDEVSWDSPTRWSKKICTRPPGPTKQDCVSGWLLAMRKVPRQISTRTVTPRPKGAFC